MREREYLIDRYCGLLGYSGAILFIIGLVYLLPLLVTIFYPSELRYVSGLLPAGGLIIATGALLRWRFLPDYDFALTVKEGMVIIVFIWAVTLLYSTLPFLLISQLNFAQALFEATSGLTTTGLTVIDVTTQPRILLFYRSFTQLVGGVGIAIIALSALTGVTTSAGVSVAEGRSDLLVPNVRHSTELVIRFYLVYIILGTVALRLAGMNWFDAINHAICAVATSGFSTQPGSIGHWDSAAIEGIIVALMILGSVNFLTAYTLYKRRFVVALRNSEFRLYIALAVIAVAILTVFTTLQTYDTTGKALRVGVFEAVSAFSTTGYSTVSYAPWSQFGWLVLIVLMIMGGGSGSTAGGVKQYRIYVMYKALVWEFRRTFMPEHAVNQPDIWQGDRHQYLEDDQVRRVAAFLFLYMATLFIGTGIIAAHGYPLADSLFEFTSALSTVGLSIGITGPEAPLGILWAMITGMLLGRLEFFALIIGIVKLFRDTNIVITSPSA